MGKISEVKNITDLWEAVNNKPEEGRIYGMFFSDWCPDCVSMCPQAKKSFEGLSGPNDIMLTFDVGDRPTWRNPENSLRMDERTQLTSIPTIINFTEGTRLVENECTLEACENFFS
eukprot:CFRG6923T1